MTGGCSASIQSFIQNVNNAILNPLIALIFAAGLLVFAWGIVQFLWSISNDSESKEKGKLHMIYGIAGMAIMISAYAILQLIANTFGVSVPNC